MKHCAHQQLDINNNIICTETERLEDKIKFLKNEIIEYRDGIKYYTDLEESQDKEIERLRAQIVEDLEATLTLDKKVFNIDTFIKRLINKYQQPTQQQGDE